MKRALPWSLPGCATSGTDAGSAVPAANAQIDLRVRNKSFRTRKITVFRHFLPIGLFSFYSSRPI
jgi:hypothetical protein